ncbi:tyrosinase [Talaromyces proteolyticus]|uniref:Tyrosinase n=1 Tax=Talaromyces proteolyticus TaxID=1131652 RepID=A0AAD4L5H1_9EURO|nr:tyrosinase [Talaromyces proteolyticus]KAH8705451.1 tyrosinase [Talaromyces proteolyticus]
MFQGYAVVPEEDSTSENSSIHFSCIGVILATTILSLELTKTSQLHRCETPPTRREWRSFWPHEKQNYIHAVQCLQGLPSQITNQGTLFDDFVYVHMWEGWKSHDAASFLPWHRAFLHIYEQTLAKKCHYRGSMPYWDWEVDWQNLANSSIWDPEEGFGGEGDPNSPLSPGDGHCLIDGPFKGAQRLYFNGEVNPHCLGRAFIHFETQQKGALSGFHFRPENMGMLKTASDFNKFREILEDAAHNALHWGIRGDFSSISAGNDPIFWLHHAQLDRLWWHWQQEDPKARETQYYGKAFNTSNDQHRQGTLDDKLSFLGLWEDIKVSEVMRTDSGLLCYRY